MQTRIRFTYDEDPKQKRQNATTGRSRQKFKLNDGTEVVLFLHFKEFYFELIDNEGNVVSKGGNTKNSAVLLKQAKAELESKGCQFGDEVRKKSSDDPRMETSSQATV